jgi:hypothetical protein
MRVGELFLGLRQTHLRESAFLNERRNSIGFTRGKVHLLGGEVVRCLRERRNSGQNDDPGPELSH